MRRPLAALGAALALAGCAGELRFRHDDRLRFVFPPDRAKVEPPVLIDWTMRAFRPSGLNRSRGSHRGMFAVFVDRSPMAPGQRLDSLADDDPLCSRMPRCPDRAWLEQHGVHLTTQTELLLPALPAAGGRLAGNLRRHEITIVLLDGRGARIGESAWTRTLYSAEERSP